MGLVRYLYDELAKIGIEKESIHESEENGYTMVVFNTISDGIKFNIMFALVDDNDRVEIYVRKRIKVQVDTLEKVNDLNAYYSGVTFFVDRPDILSVKKLCFTNGDIKCVMVNLSSCLDVAIEEFNKF